mgnify:FL=1
MIETLDNAVFAIIVTMTIVLAYKYHWQLWRSSILAGLLSASLSCALTYLQSGYSKTYVDHVLAFEFSTVFCIGFAVVSSALYFLRKFNF